MCRASSPSSACAIVPRWWSSHTRAGSWRPETSTSVTERDLRNRRRASISRTRPSPPPPWSVVSSLDSSELDVGPRAGEADPSRRKGSGSSRSWRARRYSPRAASSVDLGSGIVVGGRNALRHHHPPRVQDQLAHLGYIEGVETDLHPVVPQVGRAGHHELVRLRAHERFPLLFGKREAHHGLVPREGDVDDPTDAELHPVPHEGFGRARKAHRERTYVLDRHHRFAHLMDRGRARALIQRADRNPSHLRRPRCTRWPDVEGHSTAVIACWKRRRG